jgi:hypothetical protein
MLILLVLKLLRLANGKVSIAASQSVKLPEAVRRLSRMTGEPTDCQVYNPAVRRSRTLPCSIAADCGRGTLYS